MRGIDTRITAALAAALLHIPRKQDEAQASVTMADLDKSAFTFKGIAPNDVTLRADGRVLREDVDYVIDGNAITLKTDFEHYTADYQYPSNHASTKSSYPVKVDGTAQRKLKKKRKAMAKQSRRINRKG